MFLAQKNRAKAKFLVALQGSTQHFGVAGGSPRTAPIQRGLPTRNLAFVVSWIGIHANGEGSSCRKVSAVASLVLCAGTGHGKAVTMNTQDTNTKVEKQERKYFGGNLENHKQILVDGAVAVAPYSPNCCIEDENGNEIEATRGHAWRLAVDPDYEGYLDRDEGFSLFVEITDHEMPIEKAAFQRIYAAAEELQALARKIEVAYIQATGDIEPSPTSGDDLLAKYETESGEEIVPGVRIKHNPKSCLVDENGSEIEGTRGHIHGLEFIDKAIEECGGVFTLADFIDDRDAPTVNEAAAKRLLAASDQLRDAAFQLAPHTPEKLPRLMVEVIGGDAPRHVVEFKDPRVGFCQQHYARSTDGTIARAILHPSPNEVANTDFTHGQKSDTPTTGNTDSIQPLFMEVTEPKKRDLLIRFSDPREFFKQTYERENPGSQCRPIITPGPNAKPDLEF